MKKHTLTDSQWECIKDMLPFNGRRGNQWKDHRMVINGILWILKNGAPWRSLPPKYGHWKTVFKRFRLWTRQGLWDRILERLQTPWLFCSLSHRSNVCLLSVPQHKIHYNFLSSYIHNPSSL